MPGFLGASSGGRGRGGTVGARIRGLGVSGPGGGGALGGPYHMGGGGGGSNTEHGTIYICSFYVLLFVSTIFYVFKGVPATNAQRTPGFQVVENVRLAVRALGPRLRQMPCPLNSYLRDTQQEPTPPPIWPTSSGEGGAGEDLGEIVGVRFKRKEEGGEKKIWGRFFWGKF